jgi:ATP/maltotriose-dependent transcriptional regulator MalT
LSDTLRSLGDLARDRGELDRALAYYSESAELALEHGDRLFTAAALAGIASVSTSRGQHERAARLYGASAALREQIGITIEHWERAQYERQIAAVQQALSPDVFEAAWEDGGSLSFTAAISEALAEPGVTEKPSTADGANDPAHPSGLTTREAEVLRLLAGGHSDSEIAGALFISPRTVGGHVTNLLSKLGVDSRTAAVAIAIRQGLV